MAENQRWPSGGADRSIWRPWLFAGASVVALVALAAAVSASQRRGWRRPSARRGQKSGTVRGALNTAQADTDPASTAERNSCAESASSIATQVSRIREATVFLKTTVAGNTLTSGAGFVIEVKGDSVLLATSRNIAVLDHSKSPQHRLPEASQPEIVAVFRSGQGVPIEQTLPRE